MIDVLIQAGHEGLVRNGGIASHGTSGEVKRTVPLANDVAELLNANGFTVQRENATFDKTYDCKLAVFLHFDGSGTPCASGASIGYPDPSPPPSNKDAANEWKRIYGEIWPFKWMPDNFTGGLSGYYGYKYTNTEVAEVLLEMGELTCPEQRAWLDANLEDGTLAWYVAFWVSTMLGRPIGRRATGWQAPGDPINNEDDAKRALAYQGSLNTSSEIMFKGRVADLLMQHDIRIRQG